MIGVGGVTDNALVLLVEGVHRSPSKRDSALQYAGMVRQGGVMPCSVVGASASDAHAEPRGIAEVAVLCRPTLSLTRTLGRTSAEGK